MKIEIRKTRTDGIIQITTLDERFYAKTESEKVNEKEVEVTRFNPSITWIEKYSPMGIGLLKYYAKHGWDEAKILTEEAAERGSKVHQAIDILLQGGKVEFDTKLADPDAPTDESKYAPLTPDEYWSVMTFKDWWDDLNANHVVKPVDTEKTVWVDPENGEKYGYAGTRDIKLIVDGEFWAIDIKTGQAATPYLGWEMQLSAIKHADPDLSRTFILQPGYRANKRGWKFTETEDKFPLFKAAFQFWKDANPDTKPKQKDYPPEISLTFYKKELEPITTPELEKEIAEILAPEKPAKIQKVAPPHVKKVIKRVRKVVVKRKPL